MTTPSTWAVDEIAARRVRLVADHDLSIWNIPRREVGHLPTLAAGDVIAVSTDPATGKPQWSTARVLEGEGAKRHAEAARTLSKLQERDPGGDLTL